jgi:polysaccharide biosynthesis transport protein
MSTATPTRPTVQPSARPSSAPAPTGGMGLVTIDPIRLVRRHYKALIASVIIGAVLGVVAHLALLRLSPQYTAFVLLETQPLTSDVKSVVPLGTTQEEVQRFMGTQVAIMQSVPILQRAVTDPQVAQTEWARQFIRNGNYQPDDALRQIQHDLSARVMGGTNLLRLSMTYNKPEDTAIIANAVSRVYMDQLRADTNSERNEKRQILDANIKANADEVDRLTRQRNRLMEDQKIVNLKMDIITTQDMKISAINNALVELTQEYAQLLSRKTTYEKLFEDNQVSRFPDDLQSEAKQDPVVLGLENQLSTARTDVQTLLQQGYGENHQTVGAVRKRIDAIEVELASKREEVMRKLFAGLLDRMRTQLQGMEAEQTQLEKQVEELTTRKQDETRARVQIEQIEKDIERLNLQQQELRIARDNIDSLRAQVFDRVQVRQPAQIPKEVSFPKLTIMLPLGVLLMSGLVSGVIVLRELLDQRVRGPADLTIIPRLRVLGMIPDLAEDPARPASIETAFRDSPNGVITESFRQLRAPIVKRMDQEGFKTLLVLSGNPSSGATTVVSNLAIACAGADERVLVIDANLRRPSMHRVFGVGEGQGLGDCLSSTAKVPLLEAIRPTAIPNVSVLTAGTSGTRGPERLGSETMTRLLAEAATHFDRVIVDSAPAVVAGDGFALTNRVDAVVLVVRALSEKRGLVNRLRVQLAESRAELLGVVVNGVRSATGGYFKTNIRATHEYQAGEGLNGKA